MSEIKLKPCPFCGSTKLKINQKSTKHNGEKAYVASIRCNVCHARGGAVTNITSPYVVKGDAEAEVVSKWNSRAITSKENVAAKWEICSDGYYPFCSNCKQEPSGRKMTDYCPNCGARMMECGTCVQ